MAERGCYFLLFWASGFFGVAEGRCYFVLLSAILGSSATPISVCVLFKKKKHSVQWRLHNCGNTTEATTHYNNLSKKRKKHWYSGAHSRVSTLIQPSFQKQYLPPFLARSPVLFRCVCTVNHIHLSVFVFVFFLSIPPGKGVEYNFFLYCFRCFISF